MNHLIAAVDQGGSSGGGTGGASNPITNPALGPALQGKTGNAFFQSLIPSAVGLAFVIGALIFFFVMIIGAIQWISSGGDKAALESARGKIVNAIVGIILLFVVFALLRVIQTFFGINILRLDIVGLSIK